MRDVLIIPFDNEEYIVAASDNSGSIGMKEQDAVQVPYEVAGYYSFRVAAMECISAGAQPFAVILQNFCSEEAWAELVRGINKGMEELSLDGLQITGSTESNFTLQQSAAGITVLGKKSGPHLSRLPFAEEVQMAVIGAPLAGSEVMEKEGEAAPLSLFKLISRLEDVSILPVGSKGILYELNELFTNRKFGAGDFETGLDLQKSAGPATCFIIVYPLNREVEVKSIAGPYLHRLEQKAGG